MGLTLAACSQARQLTEMHDSTAAVSDTTKQMNDSVHETNKDMGKVVGSLEATNTGMQSVDSKLTLMNTSLDGMKSQLQNLSSTTSGLCQGSRQALALQSRDQLLDDVESLAADSSAKIALAGKYFKAFEFQAWGICGTASPEEREILMGQGAQEFFFTIQRFVNEGDTVHPRAQTSLDSGHIINNAANKDASFNAVSVTMHLLNHLQELKLKELAGQAQPVSMYSMIKDSLALESKVNAGSVASANLKDYQRIVLQNRPTAIRLLQARQNMMLAIYLKKVKELVVGFGAGVPDSIAIIAAKLNTPWKFSIDKLSVVELQELTTFLNASMETRQFLKSNGLPLGSDEDLQALAKTMNVVSSGVPAIPVLQARKELIATVNAYKAQL